MDKLTEGLQIENFNEYVRGSKRGVIELAAPVVDIHSWWNNGLPALQTVLGMDTEQIHRLIYIAEGVKDGEIVTQRSIDGAMTGTDAIEALLKKVNLDALYMDARNTERNMLAKLDFMDAELDDDQTPRINEYPEDGTELPENEHDEEAELELAEKEKERCEICPRLMEAQKMIDAILFLKKRPWKINSIRVLPVQLRNILKEESGRCPYRTYDDISHLYKRVIDRNARLKRLMELDAPGLMLRNEKRILQKMVDELYANGSCPDNGEDTVRHPDGTRYISIDDIILQNVPRW